MMKVSSFYLVLTLITLIKAVGISVWTCPKQMDMTLNGQRANVALQKEKQSLELIR